MFLTNWRSPSLSEAPRFTVYYALLFAVVSAGGLALLYLLVDIFTQQAVDTGLKDKARELRPRVMAESAPALREMFGAEATAYRASESFHLLLAPDGQVIAVAPDAWQRPPVPPFEATATNADWYELRTVPLLRAGVSRPVRVITVWFANRRVLQLGADMTSRERLLALFRNTAGLVWLVMLTMVVLVGRAMARRVLAGVRRITRVANRVAEGQRSERVQVADCGEDIRSLGQAFNAMADHMETLLREMRQANDDMVHDLRSPITRIRGLAEMAITARRGAAAEAVEGLGSIVEECDRMLNLITTLLDISEAEAGIGRPNLEEFDLRAVVTQAVDLFEGVAEERKVALRADTPEVVRVRADRRKIQRVLSNLIDNAVKYTARGEIVVALSQENGIARLSVRDTGVGLTEADVARVFERFYRCDSSRNQPGNGLGLSLARAIIRAHGGDITVKSVPGAGSDFTVTLPVRRAPAQAEPAGKTEG